MRTTTLIPIDSNQQAFSNLANNSVGKMVIIIHYSALYGANISLIEFLSHTTLPRDKFVVIMPQEGTIIQKLQELGISYVVQWFPSNIHEKQLSPHKRVWRGVKKLKASLRLYRTIKQLNPVMLYSNSSVIYHGFYISKMLRIPHVWHLREFGWEDYQVKHDFSLNVFRNMLKANSFNIAISNVIAGYFDLRTHPRTKVIYNGVIQKARLLEAGSLVPLGKIIRFGSVGLITPYKNQLKLVKAFHKFIQQTASGSILNIIGSSGNTEYFNSIEEYIRENALQDSVILMGHVSDRKNIYGAFDILLNGAEHEGFGRVTAEAMSFGKIPVAIKKGGNVELIEDQVTGLLFESFEQLPDLLTYLDDDRDYLLSLRNKMLSHFNIKFTVDYYCSEIDTVLKKLQPQYQ